MARVRRQLTDYLLGIILALAVFLGANEALRLYRWATIHTVPAEAFFEPIQLNVPDFSVDGNPIIFYDRIIHKEFVGNWTVEVQLIQSDGSPTAVCTGAGQSIFMPEKKLPEGGATLDWFLDKHCTLGAGEYRVVANWIITRPGATGDVTTRLVSNIFKVRS